MDTALLNYLEGFVSPERLERFDRVLEKRTNYLTVALEDVFQLHNASAVLRSCEVFGVQQFHLVEQRFKQPLDKHIAMGAQQWIDIHRYADASACIASLRNKGYKIIATTPHDDACPLDEFELTDKTAVFFGTEKDGLSDTAIREADGFITIPMVGFTESLNIAVAAGIVLKKLTSDLRQGSLDWSLTDAEKMRIRFAWIKGSIKAADKIIRRYHRQ